MDWYRLKVLWARAPVCHLRNAQLFIIAAYSLSRLVAYLGPLSPNQTPTQLAFVDQFIPLWLYCVAWALAMVLALGSILTRRFQPWAIGLSIALNGLWSLTFFLSWVFLDTPRSWVTAASYLAIMLMIATIGLTKERVS